MTANTVTCPADGCDYTGVFNSVCAHFAGSRDDAHDGGYEYARTRLEEAGHSKEPKNDEQQSDESTESDELDDPAMGGPSMDTPSSAAGASDEPNEPDDDTISLPCCGQEINSSEIPPNGAIVTCEDCGKQYEVTR